MQQLYELVSADILLDKDIDAGRENEPIFCLGN